MKLCSSRYLPVALALVSLAFCLAGCGNGTTATTAAPAGLVNLSVTDAPGLEYANVWITVKGVWFHASADAGDVAKDSGWVKIDLPQPMSIDLATLATGNLQALFAQAQTLPAGSYRQIRVFLASTEAPLTVSAQDNGLTYNNEVRLAGDATHYPLRVPAADSGIKLVPETPVVISSGIAANIALDFNVGDDVVKTVRPGTGGAADDVEFVLKPRLGYFDTNNAAAITGSIAPPAPATFANYSGKNYVVHAEQPNRTDGQYRVAARSTTIKSDGSFFLYPLPVFGNATTATFDVVIRGLNVQTRIVTGVKVHKGASATTSTVLGPAITVARNSKKEYKVQASVKPTGSWVNFYQTLPGDAVPYLIRTRHVDPFSAAGSFYQPIELSQDALQVAPWNNGQSLTFTSTTPVEGTGSFSAIAQALLYDKSAVNPVTPLTTTLTFGTLGVSAPAGARRVTGSIQVPGATLNRGAIFAVQGGLIVDRFDANGLMQTGINSYEFGNLPGSLADSFYSLFAVGWDSTKPKASRTLGSPVAVDLRTGDGVANFHMDGF